MNSLALLLSLSAMVCVGVGWFLAARVSKTLPPVVSAFLFQAVGIPFFLFLFPLNHVAWATVNWGGLLLLGMCDAVVMFVMFRAMKEGDVSIVMPISNSYGLVTFLLGVVFLGESISILKIFSTLLVIGGIIGLSVDIGKIRSISLNRGVSWAITGAIGSGVYLFFATILTRGSGWFYTALLIRVGIAAASGIVAMSNGQIAVMKSQKIPWLWLVSGAVLDAIGFSLYNAAVAMAETSKVTVIVSASTLIIVLLGVFVLKEKLTKMQWGGAFLIIAGLMALQF